MLSTSEVMGQLKGETTAWVVVLVVVLVVAGGLALPLKFLWRTAGLTLRQRKVLDADEVDALLSNGAGTAKLSCLVGVVTPVSSCCCCTGDMGVNRPK